MTSNGGEGVSSNQVAGITQEQYSQLISLLQQTNLMPHLLFGSLIQVPMIIFSLPHIGLAHIIKFNLLMFAYLMAI